MVKICQTGLLTLNFESIPKKRIFRFLPKISAGHAWSWKFFFANFQILGPLGCQGWVVMPQNVKKSQNHCTLLHSVKGWCNEFSGNAFRPIFAVLCRAFTPEILHTLDPSFLSFPALSAGAYTTTLVVMEAVVSWWKLSSHHGSCQGCSLLLCPSKIFQLGN